jgi:hypothetical protein
VGLHSFPVRSSRKEMFLTVLTSVSEHFYIEEHLRVLQSSPESETQLYVIIHPFYIGNLSILRNFFSKYLKNPLKGPF